MKKIVALKDGRMYHGYEVTRDAYWIKLRWIDRGVHVDISIPLDLIDEEIEEKGPENHTEQGEEKKNETLQDLP
jgi:hypothetical protein